jgi:5-methyltetrahydrofolate--homocysteine methyltransferase
MLVIGENINATNRGIAEAITKKDNNFIQELVKTQVEAGTDFIDVNAGTGHGTREEQIANMEWLVETVQEVTDTPLCIDSDESETIAAALKKYRGEKVLINSISAEPDRLNSIAPLAAERGAWVIALAMGADGIPDNVDKRLEACDVVMAHVTKLGMSPEQVFFDPLVLPISVDPAQGLVTLEAIRQIKMRIPGVQTAMGLSNVSYGLPDRKLINKSFLVMAAAAGLDAAILDPLDAKIMSIIKVTDMLTGNDPYCKGFIRAHRKGKITD